MKGPKTTLPALQAGPAAPKREELRVLDSSQLPVEDKHGASSKERGLLTSKYSDLRRERGIPKDSRKYSFKQVPPRKQGNKATNPADTNGNEQRGSEPQTLSRRY